MYKWGAITFGIGVLLVIIEIWHASRKKGGIQSQDKQRIWGLVWLAVFGSLFVMGIFWIA